MLVIRGDLPIQPVRIQNAPGSVWGCSPSNGQAAVRTWADAAGASAGQGRSVQRGKRYPMTVTDYKRRGSTVATLVEVDRLGHAWSGGAAKQAFSDGQGPDASRMVWAFAAKQFSLTANTPRHAPAVP